uniref:Epoxide hydrolase 3 n=1 Tax=Phallusia mammillata TaxID=59560 RepID=A0A6F9DCU2_9ASCI|nr:epoxide hydrolase 3 [Phallusia mammillata]
MPSLLMRWLVGTVYFIVGAFWSVIVVISFAWYVIFKKGVKGLLKKSPETAAPKLALDKYEHDFVRVKSGMKFHCVHSGSRSNPLMLCLHGFPECWYSYHYIMDHFSENYHVVSFDMRGYGESDSPKGVGQYHLDYLATDARDLIVALGYEKAVIISHDWGGAAGWKVPDYYPEVVDKLIVMNAPHAKGFQNFTKDYPSQLLKSWYMFMYQLPYLAEFLISAYDYKVIQSFFRGRSFGIRNVSKQLSDSELEMYKHTIRKNLTCPVNYYRAANPIYSGLNLKPKSAKITVPVLVIWGKKDTALDYRCVPYFEKHCTNFTAVYIEGASHWVAIDEPEKVHEAIEQFLKS